MHYATLHLLHRNGLIICSVVYDRILLESLVECLKKVSLKNWRVITIREKSR